jgi:hypothetical protein
MGSEIVIALGVIVVVLIALLTRRSRGQRIQQRFGPEYDRVVLEQQGDSRRAKAVLADREKRVQAFSLRALSPMEREAYGIEWMNVQRSFVDEPFVTLGSADRLINGAMIDRGYPQSDFDQRAADLSVSYPILVQNYRAAHAIFVGHGDSHATTEDLHQAMVHYRSLFEELLEPAKDEFPEPAWDELYALPKDGLLEPAKVEVIDRRGRRVTRERAS